MLGLIPVWPHVGIHLRMLRLAIVRRDRQEVAGQLLRTVMAGPGSYSGQVPLGDTGRARAPSPGPVPQDIRTVLGAGGVIIPAGVGAT